MPAARRAQSRRVRHPQDRPASWSRSAARTRRICVTWWGSKRVRHARAMKNSSRTKPKAKRANDLRPEYRFDYTKAKANRFAGEMPAHSVAVLLDPDVARVFKNA